MASAMMGVPPIAYTSDSASVAAMRAGIRPFCITVDWEARDYLPHLYGAAHYTVVDDVARLPYKVADIYRRLTH